MPFTFKTIGETQLGEFVSAIPRIYAAQDAHRSIFDVWLHAHHHAAAIGEEVRKEEAGVDLLEQIADTSMWLFTALNKMEGEIGVPNSPGQSPEESLIRIGNGYSDLLWNKYPGMCPVCYWRRTRGDRARERTEGFQRECDCLLYDVERRNQSSKRKHVKAIRAFARDHKEHMPGSVDAWQEMFGKIFQANIRHLDLQKIAFHLLEEMGEVSDAMVRMYTYSGDVLRGEPSWHQIWLEEELADVSSWIFALVEKLDVIRRTADAYDKWRYGETTSYRGPIRLSGVIWQRYGLDKTGDFYCPVCKLSPECQCPISLITTNGARDQVRAKVVDVLGS